MIVRTHTKLCLVAFSSVALACCAHGQEIQPWASDWMTHKWATTDANEGLSRELAREYKATDDKRLGMDESSEQRPGVYDSFHDWNSVLVGGLSDTLDMADVIPGVGWFLKLSGKLLKVFSDPDLTLDFEVPVNEKSEAWRYRTHWDQPNFPNVPTDLNRASLRTSCRWKAGCYQELDAVHSPCWMFGPFGFELQDNDANTQAPSHRGDRYYIFTSLEGVQFQKWFLSV